MKAALFSSHSAELLDLHCSASELRAIGPPDVLETLVHAGLSAKELKDMGFECTDLVDFFEVTDLVNATFSKEELGQCPKIRSNIKGLQQAGYQASELKAMGFLFEDLTKHYDADGMLRAGFGKDELLQYRTIVFELKKNGLSACDLRSLGFTAHELEIFTPLELVRAGREDQ
eukprot:Skav211880  [mRNA]  locus=scaffold1431:424987:427549:+ [translate_table: standard]